MSKITKISQINPSRHTSYRKDVIARAKKDERILPWPVTGKCEPQPPCSAFSPESGCFGPLIKFLIPPAFVMAFFGYLAHFCAKDQPGSSIIFFLIRHRFMELMARKHHAEEIEDHLLWRNLFQL
jgi:hypothetical protein